MNPCRFFAGRVALAAVLIALSPGQARAWDPETTHVGMTERAAIDSGVHARWMEGSGQRLGWFTGLRVDPRRLDPELARMLRVAQRRGHADAGGQINGGPGACPPTPAPPETLAHCVEGDLWETTALGWVRLGVTLEALDGIDQLHHFVDAEDPEATTWRVRGLAPAVSRRMARRAGAAMAAQVGRSGFAAEGMSAMGWIAAARGPWAPQAAYRHLRQASFAASAQAREHHLALGLLGVGALLHVTQDLAFPAHARGDLAAFLMPLSAQRGDRGSQLAEVTKLAFARADLPDPLELALRAPPAGGDLRSLLLGSPGDTGGLVGFVAGRFLSEGQMPPPQWLRPELTPEGAATALLAGGAGLLEVERAGARLDPWPADAGYLRSGTGRALAAWARDSAGTVRLYLDRPVMRAQALGLVPLAVTASQTVLELLWPAWPKDDLDRQANRYEIDPLPGLSQPVLSVLVEDAQGQRTLRRRIALVPDGRSGVPQIIPAELAAGAEVVLVLEGKRADGQPVVIERRLQRSAAKQEPSSPG